jgi:hypothetical protein
VNLRRLTRSFVTWHFYLLFILEKPYGDQFGSNRTASGAGEAESNGKGL